MEISFKRQTHNLCSPVFGRRRRLSSLMSLSIWRARVLALYLRSNARRNAYALRMRISIKKIWRTLSASSEPESNERITCYRFTERCFTNFSLNNKKDTKSPGQLKWRRYTAAHYGNYMLNRFSSELTADADDVGNWKDIRFWALTDWQLARRRDCRRKQRGRRKGKREN